MMKSQTNSKRPTCPNCSKPVNLCLCVRIKTPHLRNKVHITILQHSLEKKHPLNSTRIAKLGLENIAVVTVNDVNIEARIEIRPLICPGGVSMSGSRHCTPTVCENVNESFELESTSKVEECRKECNSQIDENLFDIGICESNANGEDFEHSESCGEKPILSIAIGKHGSIISLLHQLFPQVEERSFKFEELIPSLVALEGLANGFVVKKLQKVQCGEEMQCEEIGEYEIRVPPGSALLFPGENSFAIEETDFEVKHLIVLDGTWAKARRIYGENPWLRLLPCVRLDIDKVSLFREVRHQPKAGYLSTIESIVYALEALGDDNSQELYNLLDVFESMVEDQRRCKDERMKRVSE